MRKIDYVAQAVLGLSNFGGISIMTDPLDSDYLYYQWYEEEPVRTQLYHVTCDETGDNVLAFFIEEEVFRIDEFMRISI